jgi:hypothetical protein
MVRIPALLLALFLAAGCANELVLDEDGAVAVIPHRVGSAGHIVVETMLNGRGPFMLALDTGATISAVFDKAGAEEVLELIPGETINVLGMTGYGRFPVARIAQFSVGRETWSAARVAVMPGDTRLAVEIDGVLGIDFLSRYAIHYSQQDKTLRFYPRELVRERDYQGWNTIPLYDLKVGADHLSLYGFDIYIDAVRIPVLFDLGSSANLMNRRAAKSLDIRPSLPRDRADVRGAFGKPVVVVELMVWRMKIAGVTWHRRSFLIGEFPIFDVLDLGNRPLAVAGTDMFRQHDFIIDFAGKRILARSKSTQNTDTGRSR